MSNTQLHPEPPETERTETERRLRDVLDRSEIADLVARSLAAIDEGRFDDLRTIYTEDAPASAPGGQAQGRDAIVAQGEPEPHPGAQEPAPRRRRHRRPGRVRAQVRANVLAAFAPSAPEDGSPLGAAGRGQLRHRVPLPGCPHAEGWRLSEVQITPLWVSGSTEGLLARATTGVDSRIR